MRALLGHSHSFFELLVSGSRLRCLGVFEEYFLGRQWIEPFGIISHNFCWNLPARENLDIISTSPSYPVVTLLAQCLARQWIHVPVRSRVLLDVLLFYMKVNSDPEVDSRPVLWRVILLICRMEKCAQVMLQLPGLPEPVALENLDITSTSPSHVTVPRSLSGHCWS